MKGHHAFVLLLVVFGFHCTASAQTVDIWKAAATGDVEAIEQNLADGVDINTAWVQPGTPGSGGTPLHLAVVSGQVEAARFLLKAGADINAQASDQFKGTPLHWAAFVGNLDAVKFLISKAANVNATDTRGNTPLDAARDKTIPSKDKPAIVALLGGKTNPAAQHNPQVTPTPYRGSYFVNGEIHVNKYGTPEGKPLTSGHQDFKPSWSKTDDMLVFFRRLKNDPVVTNWITAICIINVDGTGFHQLTDGTHTDFNQTWTRDGTNTPIWNRKNPQKGNFYVVGSKIGNRPGQEVPLTDKSYHTWAYTTLVDGRILVQSAHPKQGYGYFLMTPNPNGEPKFERIDCELATKGILDRVSVSPSEKQVCFEYQTGFKYKDTGRTLYIADFSAKTRTISNPKPIANEEANPSPWYAYPRFNREETAIVYHANRTGKGELFLYRLKEGTTAKVSTNDNADYRYPHMERAPK